MSISTGATDVVGGYPSAYAGGYGGLGGFGGLGLVGLIGLNSFLGNRGFGDGFGTGFPGAGAAAVVADQSISDLREEVAGVNTTVHALGNEIQAALAQQTLGQTGEFRNLDNRLCDSEKAALQMGYAQSLQGFQNTQQITNLVTAFQNENAAQFCEIKGAIHADGDATRALINSIEMQNLRDALELERRGRAEREIEINITNSNQQTQNQLQAQLQAQSQILGNALNMLGDQVARQTNSIINLGSGIVASPQTATAANTKVNS